MTEQVELLDLGVQWDPNAPSAVLISDDSGATALALNPHFGDEDRRCVVAVWHGTRWSQLSDPNDEALSGHRLYGSGLENILWAGHVRDSELVRALERQNRVHPGHDASRFDPLVHHVLTLKECVAEVVAESVEVRRTQGTTLDAAAAALR